ncbi:MAG TPA: FIST N-terminal domain-containing protein [Myxococcota bacterium]|nr:FIST N-terminal domain-containing protein [Myxococcota bacterium]
MTRAGLGLSSREDAREAAEEAVAAALETGLRADGAVLLATPAYGSDMEALLAAAGDALGTQTVVGAHVHGVLGSGQEIEGGHGLAVLAIEGLELHGFLLEAGLGDEIGVAEEIAARLGNAPRPEDLVVLFPDPRAVHLHALLDGIRKELGPAQIVGAGAATLDASGPLQWCGREAATGAVSGLVLRGARVPRVGVTQACRPSSPLLTVTRTQGHWILELDGRPALDVYREVARGPLAEDLRRAAAFVLAALPRDPESPLAPGNYLVRNVAGFALEERALAIPEALAPGDRVAFVHRDPAAAREDLKAMLAQLREPQPAFGVYFDCCARGSSFFGVPGLEAAYLEESFGRVPVAGLFGSCEIGPVAGRPELLTYTGVLALVDS